jgi:adenylate cyclase
LGTLEAGLRDEFADGLEAYRAHDWDRAENHFKEALKIKPDDGPAAVFVERVRSLRNELPPAWDGVWRFTEK